MNPQIPQTPFRPLSAAVASGVVLLSLLLLRTLSQNSPLPVPQESDSATSAPHESSGPSLRRAVFHAGGEHRGADSLFPGNFPSAQEERPESTTPPPETNGQIAEIVAFYMATADPDNRASLAAELADIPSPAAVHQLLDLLTTEQQPQTHRDLLYALATSAARRQAADRISLQLQEIAATSTDPEERALIGEVMAEAPTAATVGFLRQTSLDDNADPYERLTASEGLMRISITDPELVPRSLVLSLEQQLRLEALAAAGDADYQAQALMALGGRKEENRAFFEQMLASSEDPGLRRLLTGLIQ